MQLLKISLNTSRCYRENNDPEPGNSITIICPIKYYQEDNSMIVYHLSIDSNFGPCLFCEKWGDSLQLEISKNFGKIMLGNNEVDSCLLCDSVELINSYPEPLIN